MGQLTNVFDFITEATKERAKLRMAVMGPSGSGKTFSGINILMEMGCKNILVLDTEHGSAAKYSNNFARKFKVVDNNFWKSNFDPRKLIAVLKDVGPQFDGVVVDSLTHFWMGPGGMLTLVDEFAKQASRTGGKHDTFNAWKKVDPIYAELVQTILALPCHFVAAMRAKSEYVDVVVDGKKKKVKEGMAAQMREGFEYEFDVEGMMTMDHEFVVGKTRCSAIDGKTFARPGANIAGPLLDWLTDGVEPSEKTSITPVANILTPEVVTAPTTSRSPERLSKAVQKPTSTKSLSNRTEEFLARIKTCTSAEEFKTLADQMRAAFRDKAITHDDYTTKISPLYLEKQKEFAGAPAAA